MKYGPELIVPQAQAIARLPSPHYSKGRRGAKIDLIVIHATESSLQSAVDWLRNPSRKTGKSSAHYVIDKNGATVQLVDEKDTAWHAIGRWDNRGNINGRSVGVELVNANDGKDPYSPAQLSACLALNIDLCKRKKMGYKQVAGHGEIDLRLDKNGRRRRTDPGLMFPWGQYRASLYSELLKEKRNAKK